MLEYASKTVDFKQKGKNFIAHCPKHIDKTPSLTINVEDNYFFCFSCKHGGNLLEWLIYMEGLKFPQAVEKVSKLSGIAMHEYKISETVAFYKQLAKLQEQKKPPIVRPVLDKATLAKYELSPPQEWVDEGIDPEIMKRYDIRLDKHYNRIIYPVYDKYFNLIGIKGRTRYENYKDLGIQKYQNYNSIGTTDFFCGMKNNIDNITRKNEVIIFEGIKSGMKAEAWGYDNWVACETSCLNKEQVKILIELGVKEVVIAFDSDVELKQIRERIRLLRRFTNVYCVIDKKRLLGDKSLKLSPVDKGKEVWEQLYKERVRIE